MDRLDQLTAGTKVPAQYLHDCVWLNKNFHRYQPDQLKYNEARVLIKRLMREAANARHINIYS